MKVLMVPVYERNPYQQLLAQALRGHGVEVVCAGHHEGRQLLRLVERERPGAVHLHWTHKIALARSRTSTLARSARLLRDLARVRRSGTRVVWTVHNLLEHERRHPHLELLANRRLASSCDALIVHGASARDALVRSYRLRRPVAERIHVIPHAHYLDAYPNRVSREEARSRLGLEPGVFVYLFLGHLRGYKALPELLASFERLADPQARLLVVGRPTGSADEQQRTRKLLQGHPKVRSVPEFVPDDQIQVYMNAADAMVLPSRRVLTSGSAVLGMSFARAIVAPREGCFPELVDPEGGALYEPADRDGLLQGLRAVRKADTGAMGRRNQRRIRRHGWDRAAARTCEAYLG